ILLAALAVYSAQAVLFATKVVQNDNEPLPASVQMPNHIRLRRSGAGLTPVNCHRGAIARKCSMEGDNEACVRETCANCIGQSMFNPFEMYCMRLTACVCTIINDPSCYAVVAADCY
ncbi:hypothetical protein PFISCL1PPCAC_8592, partial [Pristionchus fissidentatus]